MIKQSDFKRMKRTSVFLAALILVVSCSPSQQQSATKSMGKDFNVGVLLPLTGPLADYGNAGLKAIRMAVDEVNAKGGVKGRKLVLKTEDDKGLPKEAVTAAQKLISVDHVAVIIGGMTSSVGLAIAPIAEQTKTVLFAPGSSAPSFRDAGDYCFRNWTSDDQEARLMAAYLFNVKKVRTIAVLFMQNDYSIGLADAFKKHFAELGGKVVFEDQFAPDTTQFQAIITKMKATNPEAVFLPVQPKEGGFLVKEMAELRINAKIASNMGVESPDFLSIAGQAAEGVLFSTPAFDPNSSDSAIAGFTSAYKKLFGKEPDVAAGHCYDAINILVAAANSAKDLTADFIKDSLYQIKDFPGVTGKTTFDDHGDVFKPVMIKVLKGGKSQLIESYGFEK